METRWVGVCWDFEVPSVREGLFDGHTEGRDDSAVPIISIGYRVLVWMGLFEGCGGAEGAATPQNSKHIPSLGTSHLSAKALAILFIILLSPASLPARHIAGADLYYRCIDPAQNRYEFELWLYRDCTDPQGADYDNPIVVYIFRGDGTLHATQNITLTSSGPWDPAGVDACFLQRPGTCLEEGVYRFTLTLPPRTDGYYVAWARCCRNATITNLDNPLNMGITYLARIPPARRAACNNSPRFIQRPPFFLCAGQDFYFNHSATDADGDSLVYQIVAAYHSVNTTGQGAVNPAQGGSPAVGPSNPMGPPPYQTVTYAPGYSATQPFGAAGICQINPNTGELHLFAPNPGLYVVAIAVLEYRNGEFLGETRRDMQFYVAPCRPPTAPPVVSHDLTGLVHRGDTVVLIAGQSGCFTITIADTQPPTPPAVLSYSYTTVGLSPTIQASGTNPLLLQMCISPACQDTGRIIPLYITGRKTEVCGTTEARDIVWVEVVAPPPRSIAGNLSPPTLPVQNSAFLLNLDSTACARFWVVARPAAPPVQFSYTASVPTAQIQISTSWRSDTLEGELCYTGGCEALSTPIWIALEAQAPTPCPPVPIWRDTLRFLVELPQNPAPTLVLLSPNPLTLTPDSSYCLRVQIADAPPFSQHTLYVQSYPPLLRHVSLSPQSGSLSWEAELCFQPTCEAIGETLLIVVEVRDSLSCAELHRRYDTLQVAVVSRPTYPLALYTPPWTLQAPFQPIYRKQYCFPITVRDTAGNGGNYTVQAFSPVTPLQVTVLSSAGDSLAAEVCFQLDCGLRIDSVYPIIIRAENVPVCATAPPATVDTLWIRPQNLPNNRPPVVARDRPSPWLLAPSGDSVCYTLTITDPDTFVLLAYQGIGEAFSPGFYYGSNFSISATGTNPLYLRLCAQINCYAQGQRFPVTVCITDTTSCDPSENWTLCDTMWIETQFCHGIIPNVFTPNGDGVNDLLYPYDLAGIATWRLTIWDRWGHLTFAGEWNEPWDGRAAGSAAPEGVYFYQLELRLLNGQGPELRFTRTGSVSLLR